MNNLYSNLNSQVIVFGGIIGIMERVSCRPFSDATSCRLNSGAHTTSLSLGYDRVLGVQAKRQHRSLKLDEVGRLKQLEQENSRLKCAVSDLTLEKLILKEAASGNF